MNKKSIIFVVLVQTFRMSQGDEKEFAAQNAVGSDPSLCFYILFRSSLKLLPRNYAHNSATY